MGTTEELEERTEEGPQVPMGTMCSCDHCLMPFYVQLLVSRFSCTCCVHLPFVFVEPACFFICLFISFFLDLSLYLYFSPCLTRGFLQSISPFLSLALSLTRLSPRPAISGFVFVTLSVYFYLRFFDTQPAALLHHCPTCPIQHHLQFILVYPFPVLRLNFPLQLHPQPSTAVIFVQICFLLALFVVVLATTLDMDKGHGRASYL